MQMTQQQQGKAGWAVALGEQVKAFYGAMPDELVAAIYNEDQSTRVAKALGAGWTPGMLAAMVSDGAIGARNPASLMKYRLQEAASQAPPERGWQPGGRSPYDEAEGRARMRLQEIGATSPGHAEVVAEVRAILPGKPTEQLVLRNVVQELRDRHLSEASR
jgi:hypothetical protein